MTIELYKSLLCPRCAYAGHILKKLQKEYDDLTIITYDIATDYKIFKKSGITMIPAIKIKDQTDSWVFPKESQIRDFVLSNR